MSEDWLDRMVRSTLLRSVAKLFEARGFSFQLRAARPGDPEDAAKRAAFVDRQRLLRNDIDALFVDCAAWNRQHPDEPPIVPDPDWLLCRLARALDESLAQEACG